MGFPGGAVVKNPPARAGEGQMGVQSLGLEDPLEKEIATHSSILAWRIPWTEEPGGLQSMSLTQLSCVKQLDTVGHNWTQLDTTEHTCTHTHIRTIFIYHRLYLVHTREEKTHHGMNTWRTHSKGCLESCHHIQPAKAFQDYDWISLKV